MKQVLTAVAVIVALTSLAWAQPPSAPGWGEPGVMAAVARYGGQMLVDPIYLGVVVVSLLIASRFVHWPLLPLGGVAGALGVFVSTAITAKYAGYAFGSMPFWVAAVFLGVAFGLAALIVTRFFKG